MTRKNQDPIRYEAHQSQTVNDTSSFQVFNTAQKRYDPSFIGSPPPFIITQGHNYSHSPIINSQLIGGSPPITHHLPPHLVQGNAPILIRQGVPNHTIGSHYDHSINGHAQTIIKAPVPIIKPIIYQTVESTQHRQTIQKLMQQYSKLYDLYEKLRQEKDQNKESTEDNRYRTISRQTKRQITENLFSQMLKQIDSTLDRYFEEGTRSGWSVIQKITDQGISQIQRMRYF